MKILHTSDWHLGRTLYTRKERSEEHRAFLEWLLKTIRENAVEVLVVAGDIFDSGAPSGSAQKMYYDFLLNVRESGCRHVIIVGGNHDSPGLLNAPKEILSALNVLVVGKASENPEEEVFVLRDENENPMAVIGAVPYLRERDLNRYTEGESYAGRSKRMAENIRKHYAAVAAIAEQKRDESENKIPIIATGHLSIAGGARSEDDGVRDIYIGAIECLGSDIFPSVFDYVALGHFHIASAINGNENIRYSGSPIPMGFGEAKQIKNVIVADFEKNEIQKIEIPVFQKLESVKGDKNFIAKRLSELKESGESVWIEVIYDGHELFSNLSPWVSEQLNDSNIEVLKIQNKEYLDRVLTKEHTEKSLEELNELEVFKKLLEDKDFPDEQMQELEILYREILSEIHDTGEKE
ncbi:MAG: exonuclease SbcCD subunit D C-terminal domain-containing protein [Fibrobacter sp.]|jgi:exonuclease SbcD|nr:exonuclease SbcCD subunit D C-terminal domain-containing protein [Fibrobacter sp.]